MDVDGDDKLTKWMELRSKAEAGFAFAGRA